MGRPGVMLYYEWIDTMSYLTVEEFGQMMRDIFAYCKFGVVPEFEMRELKMLWSMIQPKLDADRISYETKVEKRRKAARCKWEYAYAQNAEEKEREKETETERETERETEIETEIETERETETEIQRQQQVQPKISALRKAPLAPFVPPTVAEVNTYCILNNLYLVGEAFVDYYTANGWMIGKHSMQDWQAAVRRWSRDEAKKNAALEDWPGEEKSPLHPGDGVQWGWQEQAEG